jgi:hypothetical protein
MTNWRNRAVFIFCAIFVIVQIAGPTYKLLSTSELTRFGWQMFSRNRIGTGVKAVSFAGETRELEYKKRFISMRGDLQWERPFAAVICRENRMIKQLLFVNHDEVYLTLECGGV